MATTHPHSAATNGHGNTTTTKIEKLLAFHEEAAAAIRMTIALMNGHAKAAKTNGHTSVLAEAIALDGARATKTKTKAATTKSRSKDRAAVLAQRERTAKVLDAFHPRKPRTTAEVATELGLTGSSRSMGIAPLIHHKYLKKQRGGGIIRTAKPYVVDPSAAASE